jgi:hypothetical protein
MAKDKDVVLDLVPLGQAQLERAQVNNSKFAGGIKDGGDFLPTLGLKGRQFHIKAGKNEVVSLEQRTLDVIMVTAREGISKNYFAGEFVAGSGAAPDCRSADGITPDADVAAKQSATCATCRMNAWGSKINKATGKEGKACADFKMMILAPPTLDSEKPLQLALPAASLKNLGLYIKLLNHNGLAANEVVTQLRFSDDAFPKLEFKYVRNLNATEIGQVRDTEARDDVKAVVTKAEAHTAPSPSEQPAVVPATPPVQDAVNLAFGKPAEADAPTDEVANILGRWGASKK